MKIEETIEIELSNKKLKYTKDDEHQDYIQYSIFKGSVEVLIDIEKYSKDDEFVLTFYTKPDDNGYSTYDETLESVDIKDGYSIQANIEQLIEYANLEFKALQKIESKIDQIKDICEELEMDLETILTINYNFED